MQRVLKKGYTYKTIICMVFAVFLLALTIDNSFMGERYHQSRSYGASEEADKESSDSMANPIESTDMWFGSILLTEMRAGSSGYIVQVLLLNRSVTPMVRFTLLGIVLLFALLLKTYALYSLKLERKTCFRYILYLVLEYIHDLDGKKTICLVNEY